MPIPKQPCQAKQRKYGLIDKVAPQESDDEDDRKPFPTDASTQTTTTTDPLKGGDQSKTNFKILMCAALLSGFLNGISDCDETFNYWEPLHYLLRGSGFQTWEYSPEYGLRSWFYILVHGLPASVHLPFMSGPMIFFFVRMMLALVCTFTQLWLSESIQVVFGGNVANLWLWLTVATCGNFVSATALLPSSTCMYLSCVWMGFWLRSKYNWAVYIVALSALFSWPFSVALGIPLAVDILVRRRKFTTFVFYAIESFVIINLVQGAFDLYFYGTPKFAWFNILTYNVFSAKGPDLYGVEPVSFYLKNLTVNFGPIWILGLFSIPICLASEYLISLKIKHYQPVYDLALWYLSPLYCWMAVFFLQPHKEERFLFPMYPALVLAIAVAIGSIQKIYAALFQKKLGLPFAALGYMGIIISGVFGLSRLCALTLGYSAPMDTYRALYQHVEKNYVWIEDGTVACTGKAWHQFPNSFFLPQNMTMQFVQSEFKGQLPGKFGAWPHGLSDIPPDFNDDNREEPSRYFANPTNAHKKCHYLIDVDYGKETPEEPLYHLTGEHWQIVFETDILDAAKSHWLHRAFYIPFLYENNVKFGKYRLLKSLVHPLEGDERESAQP